MNDYQKYYNKYNVTQSLIENTDKEFNKLFDKYGSVKEEHRIVSGASQLLSSAKSFKISKKRDRILSMINIALSDIFQYDYCLKIVSSDEEKNVVSNLRYNIVLYKGDIEISRNESILDSNGGGVQSIISFMFKLLIGIIHSEQKFFVFDESIIGLSEEYHERFSYFIKRLCEEEDVTIVMTSHVAPLLSHAHIYYDVDGKKNERGIDTLFVKKISGEFYNLENIWHLSISNFQSIEDLQFVFKGFVAIRGKNDIGKSSIVRSIMSLIYNEYKEHYTRIKKQRGSKVNIQLSKYDFPETMDKELKKGKDLLNPIKKHLSIALIKDSSNIYYTINGQEYRGKNLASTNIEKEISKIGFKKFVNDDKTLKHMKKKERLKIQNITVTSQNDPYYILSENSNDTNRIFTYLFNAEDISRAYNKSREEMQILSREESDINRQYQLLLRKQSLLKKQLNSLEKVLQSLLSKSLLKMRKEREIYSKLIGKIDSIIQENQSILKIVLLKMVYDLEKLKLIEHKKLFKENEKKERYLNMYRSSLMKLKISYISQMALKYKDENDFFMKEIQTLSNKEEKIIEIKLKITSLLKNIKILDRIYKIKEYKKSDKILINELLSVKDILLKLEKMKINISNISNDFVQKKLIDSLLSKKEENKKYSLKILKAEETLLEYQKLSKNINNYKMIKNIKELFKQNLLYQEKILECDKEEAQYFELEGYERCQCCHGFGIHKKK